MAGSCGRRIWRAVRGSGQGGSARFRGPRGKVGGRNLGVKVRRRRFFVATNVDGGIRLEDDSLKQRRPSRAQQAAPLHHTKTAAGMSQPKCVRAGNICEICCEDIVDGNPLVEYMSTCGEGDSRLRDAVGEHPVNPIFAGQHQIEVTNPGGGRNAYVGQEGLATVF